MILHNTTAVVVENKNKILLIKRRYKPEKGYWAVPGGHVDKGETAYQCAQREANEEVGDVKIITKKPFFVFVHDAELGHRHKAHVFFGKVTGKIAAKSDAAAVKWFTLSQMNKMDITHYTKIIINKLYSKAV